MEDNTNVKKEGAESQHHTEHHHMSHEGHEGIHHEHHEEHHSHHEGELHMIHRHTEHHAPEHESHHIHHTEHHEKKKPILQNIITVLGALVAIVLIVNIFVTQTTISKLTEKISIAKEDAKPALVTLFVVRDSKCIECFDVSPVIDFVRQGNINVTKEEMLEADSAAAASLVEKYSLTKLPAIVIQSDNMEKLSFLSQGFEKKNDAYVFDKPLPPYVEALTGNVKGKVELVRINDSSCSECASVEPIVQQLMFSGVYFSKQRNVDAGSAEGKSLIQKYRIKKLPTLVLSKETGDYDSIKSAWAQLGTVAEDGSYVLNFPGAPFKDAETSEVKGLVEMTYLVDGSCTTCYNVSEHRNIVTNPQSFNMKLTKETTLDISSAEGKAFAGKYNVTKVPTIVLSKDASYYPALAAVWPQVGSVEKDGTYVFRAVEVMQGPYKDVVKNEVVMPQPPTQ